uniref:Uncharacterized protein n=1 Tax=Cacopsylla melanoneura TaxID=428564 RepID=A0A8D9B7S5_9HEMI
MKMKIKSSFCIVRCASSKRPPTLTTRVTSVFIMPGMSPPMFPIDATSVPFPPCQRALSWSTSSLMVSKVMWTCRIILPSTPVDRFLNPLLLLARSRNSNASSAPTCPTIVVSLITTANSTTPRGPPSSVLFAPMPSLNVISYTSTCAYMGLLSRKTNLRRPKILKT